MKTIAIPVASDLERRLKEPRPLIQVVLGPRQIGKTTALEQLVNSLPKGEANFVSGDGVASPAWIREQWQKSRIDGSVLIIDEIQKIPRWSEMVKQLWDEDRRGTHVMKAILSGSSSLTLNRGLEESLTGRFETIPMFHWGLHWSKKLHKFSIEDFLVYGGYPGSYRFLNSKKRWADYLTNSVVETVIGKDILMQATVRSPALFRQTFYLLAAHPAQVVSYNKLLGQLQDRGNVDLIKHYIELFEAAFLFKTIFKYSRNEIQKKTSSPKIIPMAPALSTFFRLDSLSPEDQGRIFEATVGAELIRAGLSPFYWASGNNEVDFVIEYKRKLIAIEVKSKKHRSAKSLQVFAKLYPSCLPLYLTLENFEKFSKDPGAYITKALSL